MVSILPMDKIEAQQVLEDELLAYQRRLYEELVPLVGQKVHFARSSPSGTTYQVDVDVFWDDRPNGLIRIVGAIDDGSLLNAILPLSRASLERLTTHQLPPRLEECTGTLPSRTAMFTSLPSSSLTRRDILAKTSS